MKSVDDPGIRDHPVLPFFHDFTMQKHTSRYISVDIDYCPTMQYNYPMVKISQRGRMPDMKPHAFSNLFTLVELLVVIKQAGVGFIQSK